MQLHYLSIFFCDVGTLPIPNMPTLMTHKSISVTKKRYIGVVLHSEDIISLFFCLDNRLKIISTVLVGIFFQYSTIPSNLHTSAASGNKKTHSERLLSKCANVYSFTRRSLCRCQSLLPTRCRYVPSSRKPPTLRNLRFAP